MKFILALTLLVCPLLGTVLQGPFAGPNMARPFTGTIEINPSGSWVNLSGVLVTAQLIRVSVSVGAITAVDGVAASSVSLEPTDLTLSPSFGRYYTFTYYPSQGRSYSIKYSVPTSASPITPTGLTQLGDTVPTLVSAAGGDLSGTYPSPIVRAIRGYALCAVIPSDTQVLTYLASGNCWGPAAGGSGGGGGTPSAHAASHGVNGSDPVSLDASQIATGILNLSLLPSIPASQTTSGTFALARIPDLSTLYASLGAQTGNKFPGSPADGSSGAIAYRALVVLDIPTLPFSKISSGIVPAVQGGLGLNAGSISGLLGMNAGVGYQVPGLAVDSVGNVTTSAVNPLVGNASFGGTMTAAKIATSGSGQTIFYVTPGAAPSGANLPAAGTYGLYLDSGSNRLRQIDSGGGIQAYSVAGTVVTLPQTGSPGAASSGNIFLYADTGNKRLRSIDDAGAITPYQAAGALVTLPQSTSPGTPAAGSSYLYVDPTTKKIRTNDDAGTVAEYWTLGNNSLAMATAGSTPTSPASGGMTLFVDTSTQQLQQVNSSGTVKIYHQVGAPLTVANGATPATPASGNTKLFVNASKQLSTVDDAGTVTTFNAGGALGISLQFGTSGTFAPAQNTTYYFGHPARATGATAAINRVYIPRAGTLKVVTGYCASANTPTNESATLNFRLNNTSNTVITAALAWSGASSVVTFNNTAMSVAVSQNDYFEIQWVTPTTWATPASNPSCLGTAYVE